MKQILFLLGLVLFAVTAHGQKRKAIFVIVDGIPADVIEKVETPALVAIKSKGGYARAYQGGGKGTYSQSPTISAVGYNNVLTGVWANKHNVWDNDIAAPNYHYWNIFRIAKAARPSLTTAIFSTWLDNRTKLVGEGLDAAGNFKFDYSFDGYELDEKRFPHGNDRTFISRIDDFVTDEAARIIREQGPDLSWVYLEFTDDMGHQFGESPQFDDAVKKADAQIGRIWKEIETREKTKGEEWMIVITTDHGRDAATGKNHGGQSERERATWIVTNAPGLNARFSTTPAAVDIMPSILRFLDIPIPQLVAQELDGVSFLGEISLANLKAKKAGNGISLTWDAHGSSEQAEVWISRTQDFSKGGNDAYEKVGEVFTINREYQFTPGDNGAKKVLLKTRHQTITAWIE